MVSILLKQPIDGLLLDFKNFVGLGIDLFGELG